MSAPTDDAIHALTDPDTAGIGRGIRVIKRVTLPGNITSYYVDGGAVSPGLAYWIDIADSQTAAQANTAIRAKLAKR